MFIRGLPWWPFTPIFLPRKSHGQRSLVGIVYGVTKSQTQLSNQHTGGPLVKNLPCPESSIPGSGRSHILWGSSSIALHLLKPKHPRAPALK